MSRVPSWWVYGISVTLMREGLNKHRAKELATAWWEAYCLNLDEDESDGDVAAGRAIYSHALHEASNEIERLRAVIRDAGLCIKCGEPIHPNFPCAEARALRSDAAVKEQKK